MPYEVRLEVFEGPLDLLLHLITRQRVDIYDVSLATITEEYLAAMDGLGAMDLETATSFLVIAATLLELKSARLLPRSSDDEAANKLLEERDLLLARLVECATFRDAGAWIAGALGAGDSFHGRATSLEERFVDIAPDLLARVKISDIARAAGFVLAPKPVVVLDTSHVSPIRASVKDAIAELAATLEGGGRITFEALCGRQTARIEVVVRFLALLELFKAGAVDLDQVGRFGDITAYWTGEVGADEVLAEAEEYTVVETIGSAEGDGP
ncbi:MAG: segregation/condensation protein A [Actinobacteria bacterium]|nr:segregation/condensation protein A [Actinomycetota bacterium]